MKRVISSIILFVSLCVALAACSKEESNVLQVPSGSIIVPDAGMQGSTTFDSRNITSIKSTSVPEGWSLDNIDMYEGTITVTAPSSFDDGELRSGTLSLKGYTPTGSTRTISIFLAIAKTIPFEEVANCYVATMPKCRYTFDPLKGGAEDATLATAEIKLLWQTKSGLIKYLDMRENADGKMEASFYLEEDADNEGKVYHGNALIGAYDKNGEIIWSWHIWVTNNDPAASENTAMLNGQTMMSINLGAELNSDGSTDSSVIYKSYGMYYQWGRKEPFVGPQKYNFPSNADQMIYNTKGYATSLNYVESTAEYGTMAWAVANPMTLIKGYKKNGFDWLYADSDDNLWNSDTKSLYDPCPAGWRVPTDELFTNLTIAATDDDMMWGEAQKQYGWHLVDTTTAQEHFFTAQGRRNYLDCRLDIFNDDETLPVPWSGYYWTSSVAESDAKALYFDLNTATRAWNAIELSRPMHRANAMPVRCVRE